MLSKKCGNERLAMILHYVALGSMIVMTGLAVSEKLKEAFGSRIVTGGMAGPGDHAEQTPHSPISSIAA